MQRFDQVLNVECNRFQERFGNALRGILEIGSYARGEAVKFSDHYLRLVIDRVNPLYVLDDGWMTGEERAGVTLVDWSELNTGRAQQFGLTNLAYVRNNILSSRFPLSGHTCLYQGKILMDNNHTISSFHKQYLGVVFPNIIPDYLIQTTWRVNHKLQSQLTLSPDSLDFDKVMIPAVHT